MARTASSCGSFFFSFPTLKVLQELEQQSSWLTRRAEAPVWPRGRSVIIAAQGILSLYLNMVPLWHLHSGQQPSWWDTALAQVRISVSRAQKSCW